MTALADITNWRRLDARTTTSGQPAAAQLAQIASLGTGHVINLGLQTHERALPDEAGTVAALGMAYIHIPVAFDAPREADFTRFLAALAQAQSAPVHVHCILNARVSAFFYRYRREILHWDEAPARAALESIWRPGGVWAAFIGDQDAAQRPHLYAGVDYPPG